MRYTFFIFLLFWLGLLISRGFCSSNLLTCKNKPSLQHINLIIYVYKPSMSFDHRNSLPDIPMEIRNKTILIFVDFRNDTVWASFKLYLRITAVDSKKTLGNNGPNIEETNVEVRLNYKNSNVHMVYLDLVPNRIRREILKYTNTRKYSEKIATLLYSHLQRNSVKANTKIYSLGVNKTYNYWRHYRHKFQYPLQFKERSKFVIEVQEQTPLSQLFGDHIELFINYLVTYNTNECEVSNIQVDRFKLHNANTKDWIKITSKRVVSWVPKPLGLLNLILRMKEETTCSETTNKDSHEEEAISQRYPIPSTSYNEYANNVVVETVNTDFKTDELINHDQLEQLEGDLVFDDSEIKVLDGEMVRQYLNN